MELQQSEVSIEFELRAKNCLWNGPYNYKSMYVSLKTGGQYPIGFLAFDSMKHDLQ